MYATINVYDKIVIERLLLCCSGIVNDVSK